MSVTPSTDWSDHEFPKFSGDQDTVDTKSRPYIRKCMTNEISGVDKDVLRTWSSKNIAHFSSWMIKSYSINNDLEDIHWRWQGIWVKKGQQTIYIR